jgi:hypothetical protein
MQPVYSPGACCKSQSMLIKPLLMEINYLLNLQEKHGGKNKREAEL